MKKHNSFKSKSIEFFYPIKNLKPLIQVIKRTNFSIPKMCGRVNTGQFIVKIDSNLIQVR